MVEASECLASVQHPVSKGVRRTLGKLGRVPFKPVPAFSPTFMHEQVTKEKPESSAVEDPLADHAILSQPIVSRSSNEYSPEIEQRAGSPVAESVAVASEDGESLPDITKIQNKPKESRSSFRHQRRAERTWSTSAPSGLVHYLRRTSMAAPPLADALNAHTAVEAPKMTLKADSSNENIFKRAFSEIYEKLERYESQDAEEGARFEYRLARARQALPDNVQSIEDIRGQDMEDIEEGKIQPLSMRRSSTTRSEPKEKGDAEQKPDPFLVTFETTNSEHENPRTWSFGYRVSNLAMYAMFSLIGPFASSVVSPASAAIAEDLGMESKLEQNLLVGLFMLAFVVGPLCSAPVSETYGRRVVVLVCSIFFIVFNIGCAVANTAAQLLVLRFFSGAFGGAIIPMGGGTVSDMFEVHERGTAMALYTIAPVLGPSLAPIISGWIIQGWGKDHWRWVFWVSTILAGFICVLGIFFVRETYAPRLLYLKARKLRRESGEKRYHTSFEMRSETIWQKVKRILLRPLIFLITEPLVTLPALYMSIVYACFYLNVASLPYVFRDHYEYNVGIASLHYIGLMIGLVGFGQFGGWFIDFMYKRLSRKHGRRRPEYKLPLLMITVYVLPAGMLLFGWTADYHKFWIAPDIGLILVGSGIIGSMLLIQMYLADLMTIYAASAISAVTSSRSLMAFVFLLFSNAMLTNLGVGWTMSVLALIVAVVGIPAPFLLYRYGPFLRSKSKYCVQG